MNKSNFLIIILIATFCSTFAQSNKQEDININNLCKKWNVIDVINSNKTEEELVEIKSMLEGTSIEFKNDLTFTFSFVLDLEGTWVLKENVIFTEDRKGENKWVIHRLEKNILIASRNDSKQKIVFTSN